MPDPRRQPGDVIGQRYVLDAFVGEGGMGTVWAAVDRDGGRRVALKFIKDDPADPDARRRLVREARSAMAARHPHVVEVIEVVELDDGGPVLVMELLAGEPLSARLRGGARLSVEEIATLLLPVIAAVGHAHAAGIIHRDLKPHNIFLAQSPAGGSIVKVLDFGIAKQLPAADRGTMRSSTSTDLLIGTPEYMSPEQVYCEELDHRTDIWSLGIILYQCFSGVLPTAGTNQGQIIKKVLHPFPPLAEAAPEVPRELAALVDRMLSHERASRPRDLREVLAALAPFARAAVPDFAPPLHPVKEAEGPPPSVTIAPGSQVREPARRRMIFAAGALGAALVGVISWRWGAHRIATPASPPEVRSPLADATSILACPILEAKIPDDARPGWLGAAAASAICERARVILGGRSQRTAIPAELLDIPSAPSDSPAVDPFGEPDARARSVAAARQRSAAYLDGEITVAASSATDFAVSLRLIRSADGAELGRAAGSGRGLHAAIVAAMEPLVGPARIPAARSLDPEVARWARARTGRVEAALALVDVTQAVWMNAGDLQSHCARFSAFREEVPDLVPSVDWSCAYTDGLALPAAGALAFPASDDPAALAAYAFAYHLLQQKPSEADIERLSSRLAQALRDPNTAPIGQSTIGGLLSCLRDAADDARRGVQRDPKNHPGGFCEPWEQLVTLTAGDEKRKVLRAMQAWVPWDSSAWRKESELASTGDSSRALQYARRAHLLSPFDTEVAEALAGMHIAAKRWVEAENVATLLDNGPSPVHRLGARLIRMRIEAARAHFGNARAQAKQRWTEADAGAGGWARVQRFNIAWLDFELGRVLGRTREAADTLFETFVRPDPTPLEGMDDAVLPRIAAICAYASPAVSTRCFERHRALQSDLFRGAPPEQAEFARGAMAWARRDLKGAAAHFRHLRDHKERYAEVMAEPMMEAFDRDGDVEQADAIEHLALDRAAELGGASLVTALAAERALRRNRSEEARRHAQAVIDAWRDADEKVPAVDAMRALLRRAD